MPRNTTRLINNTAAVFAGSSIRSIVGVGGPTKDTPTTMAPIERFVKIRKEIVDHVAMGGRDAQSPDWPTMWLLTGRSAGKSGVFVFVSGESTMQAT